MKRITDLAICIIAACLLYICVLSFVRDGQASLRTSGLIEADYIHAGKILRVEIVNGGD